MTWGDGGERPGAGTFVHPGRQWGGRPPPPRMTSFSGHETFPLRYAWLAKSVEAAGADAEVFGDDRAIATFGVGRNMVRAIRHWGLAADVLEPVGRGQVAPTALGQAVFGPDGADPYCEDPATAWLLHWLLCRTPDRATLWHYVFGHWPGGPLDLRRLRSALDPWLADRDEAPPGDATLKRDLQCLVATYAPRVRQDPEDAVASPLAALGLVADEGGLVFVREGRHAGLAPLVWAAAVVDYWDRTRPESETLAVADLLHGPGAPGRVFSVSQEGAFDLVARAEGLASPPFRYADTAGLQQLYRVGADTPASLLARHYA